ncbi:MAG TPA: signal recognition particle-docking protein FtsY [Streptosporangiaceae bacterium]|jgi:fused signal recognition particle receptor|nr:signal recognition particle-docking protein FtsY [Streptosporangiaceae bacterium]
MVEDLIIAVAVVVAGGGAAGLTSFVRSRRKSLPPGGQGNSGGGVGTLERGDDAAGTGTLAPPEPAAPTAPPDVIVPPDIAEVPGVVVERPPPSAGRLARLRSRLARSQSAMGSVLLNLISSGKLDEQAWEDIEDTLISADMGVGPARELVEKLKTEVKVVGTQDPAEVKALLRAELIAMINPDMDRTLRLARHGDRPSVVLVVGVNGTGKTTTCGKLARVLVGDGKTVVLGAADTFRAAAADQLQTWGDRVGAQVVRSDKEGADPASVAFEAVNVGIQQGVDTVIVDTAGRLHTKAGLMDELGKIKRVIEKHGTVDEVLLVLDAVTGQNGLRQARVFAEVVDITGIILTKLDGTAKGGIVIQVQRELGVPVKMVGLGEGPDDLAYFDPGVFVDAILG